MNTNRIPQIPCEGEHTALIHFSVFEGDGGVYQVLNVPKDWTVTQLSLQPKGEFIEYRFLLTAPK